MRVLSKVREDMIKLRGRPPISKSLFAEELQLVVNNSRNPREACAKLGYKHATTLRYHMRRMNVHPPPAWPSRLNAGLAQQQRKPEVVIPTLIAGESWMRPYQENSPEVASIPVKATLVVANPPSVRFQITTRFIEKYAGLKMQRGNLYEMQGKVMGAFDFTVSRLAGEYVRVYVPVESLDLIQPGKVYRVCMTSIKGISLNDGQRELLLAWTKRGVPWNRIIYRINHLRENQAELRDEETKSEKAIEVQNKLAQLEKSQRVENLAAHFTLESHRYSQKSPRMYFSIESSLFERKTGVKIEEGKSYLIKGEIEGIGNFQKTLRSCAVGQEMPIYASKEFQSKVEAGKQYNVTIDSIERLPGKSDSWAGIESKGDREWTWRDIATWIDTEGSIYTASRGSYYVSIAQKEKKVMQEICGFFDEQGLSCNLSHDNRGVYHVVVNDTEHIARIIKNTEPFIRTENKKMQIDRFKEKISEPRKTLKHGIIAAREILGLE